MHLVYIEPFYSGSHKTWIEAYARYTEHRVSVLGLPGVHWKWRMQAGVISLVKELQTLDEPPSLFLLSDMADAALFKALLPKEYSSVPIALYFHENQLSYPWSTKDRNLLLNRRYFGFKNYTSARIADLCLFNSDFHRVSFLEGVLELEKEAPDMKEVYECDTILAKSHVVYPGVELKRFDAYRETGASLFPDVCEPILLWNHRWDYDKNPEEFFEDCYWLKDQGIAYRLILLGEELDVELPCFQEAKVRLADQLLHCGFLDSFDAYASYLWRADVLPVTSKQDFFGISIVEACYCGMQVLLPHRLAYPEVFCSELFPDIFYRSRKQRRERLKQSLCSWSNDHARESLPLCHYVSRYDWESLVADYDQLLKGHSLVCE